LEQGGGEGVVSACVCMYAFMCVCRRVCVCKSVSACALTPLLPHSSRHYATEVSRVFVRHIVVYTVVTLLLHCCHTVVTLWLHCGYTVVTLLLHCCYTVVTLLLHSSRHYATEVSRVFVA
jgi:hypothetical protein